MRNHYEIKVNGVWRVAVAGAVEHGAMWHDEQTKDGRDMTISKDSPLTQWLAGALMTADRKVTAAPLYYMVDGVEHVDGESRIVESGADGVFVSHGKTSDAEWTTLNPADFGEMWYSLADTLVAAGVQAERSVLMRLQEQTGSQLVGCIKIGEMDLGAGDKGVIYLSIATSYDNSRPSQIYLSYYRSVCANQDAMAVAQATVKGRIAPLKLQARNRGGVKLASLMDESVMEAATLFGGFAREYEERMKRLKQVRLNWHSQEYFQSLLTAGLETGALRRGKAEESIPLDDASLSALKGLAESPLCNTNLGQKIVASIAFEASREQQIGIEDCVGTAFGTYQGLTWLATRRGEEGRGPVTEMASAWASKVSAGVN